MEKKYISYEEDLLEALQDHQEALAYLNAALLDDDPRIFLMALKDVLAAQNIDISKFARDADITRQNIYRILSKKGNPRWENLTSLLHALGFYVQLTEKDSTVEPLPIDKKLYKMLSRQAIKQGVSLAELAHEKLSRK